MALKQERIIAGVAVAVSVALLIMVMMLGGQRGERLILKSCGGVHTNFSLFQVSACPDYKEGRCELIVNKSFITSLDFKAPVPFESATTYVELNKFTDKWDACKKGARCPSVVGDQQRLYWETGIAHWIGPTEEAELKIGVKINNDQDFIICYTLPVRILPAEKSSS